MEPKIGLEEARIICGENDVEQEVADLCNNLLPSLGYRLVRVKFTQTSGGTLQIMAEKLDGTLAIEDCEKINNLLSPALDVENIIPQSYNLEISSPGLDRPLVRKTDFANHLDFLIKIELNEFIESSKKYKAKLKKADEANIVIETEENSLITIAYSNIKHAYIVLTDDVIKLALKKDKGKVNA